ncbi:Thaumatin [Macleaya cordata]|uniref:Thaumatin n=1 Tax=Macleaya cordata TaxID=56857 RepID=A0A200R9X6_MACCD|nr:Thaumatin [Macleaya cordata]
MAEIRAFLIVLLATFVAGRYASVIFNYDNQCEDTIWLGAAPEIGEAQWVHERESLTIFETPDQWAGSIWVRRGCITDDNNRFYCVTGDCGRGDIFCKGEQPKYPVTLLNFAINQSDVTYEVSLVHGYNVPVRIVPVGGSGDCPTADCPNDVTKYECPRDLLFLDRKGLTVACQSPCDALKDPQYCCTGAFAGDACKSSRYSDGFKRTCPLASTYPGDKTSHKCTGASAYNITFCPI